VHNDDDDSSRVLLAQDRCVSEGARVATFFWKIAYFPPKQNLRAEFAQYARHHLSSFRRKKTKT
jgi:hypothetical protein